MKVIKSVAMITLAAGICGTSAYAAGHADSTPSGANFAIAGIILIAFASVLRRKSRRSL